MDTVVLTIAGSDTWGGGGITTDIKTNEQAGSFAVNVITCIAVESRPEVENRTIFASSAYPRTVE